jgi:hypothetical protein
VASSTPWAGRLLFVVDGAVEPACCTACAAADNGIEVLVSLEEAILETVRALPVEQQQEVLKHATELRAEAGKKSPFKSVRGLWVDLGISLSPEEIDGNQREIWRSFPREDI